MLNDNSEQESDSVFKPEKVQFPTDAIRIKDLILRFPHDFQWDPIDFMDLARPCKPLQRLADAMTLERELAESAFNRALSSGPNCVLDGSEIISPKDQLKSNRTELRTILAGLYAELGLVSGLNQGTELVRQVENSAMKLVASRGRN